MEQPISLPKAIFLDWDGTLVNSFAFLEQAHNHALQQLGMAPRPENWFAGYFGRPREEIYQNIYQGQVEEAMGLFETFVTENRELLEPLPGARDLLRQIHTKGIPMGIVSNKRGDFVKGEVAHFNWGHFFASIVGSGEAEHDKPSGAPLLHALDLANITADIEDIWYVGDTEMDLLCAQHAGCRSVFIGNNDKTSEWVQKYHPTLIAGNCHELHEFLLQCREK